MDRLHFKGKLPKFSEAKVVGPDVFGGWHRPVSQRYDSIDDMTTVFYVPVPPKDLPERMLKYSKAIAAQRKDPREWVREVVGALSHDEKWRTLLSRLITSLQSGTRRSREVSGDTALTSSQRESLKSLKRRGLMLPKHLEGQRSSGLILPS